jgi:hypothetical protein
LKEQEENNLPLLWLQSTVNLRLPSVAGIDSRTIYSRKQPFLAVTIYSESTIAFCGRNRPSYDLRSKKNFLFSQSQSTANLRLPLWLELYDSQPKHLLLRLQLTANLQLPPWPESYDSWPKTLSFLWEDNLSCSCNPQ